MARQSYLGETNTMSNVKPNICQILVHLLASVVREVRTLFQRYLVIDKWITSNRTRMRSPEIAGPKPKSD